MAKQKQDAYDQKSCSKSVRLGFGRRTSKYNFGEIGHNSAWTTKQVIFEVNSLMRSPKQVPPPHAPNARFALSFFAITTLSFYDPTYGLSPLITPIITPPYNPPYRPPLRSLDYSSYERKPPKISIRGHSPSIVDPVDPKRPKP